MPQISLENYENSSEVWFDAANGDTIVSNADGDIHCATCVTLLAIDGDSYDDVLEKYQEHECTEPFKGAFNCTQLEGDLTELMHEARKEGTERAQGRAEAYADALKRVVAFRARQEREFGNLL